MRSRFWMALAGLVACGSPPRDEPSLRADHHGRFELAGRTLAWSYAADAPAREVREEGSLALHIGDRRFVLLEGAGQEPTADWAEGARVWDVDGVRFAARCSPTDPEAIGWCEEVRRSIVIID